MHKETELFKENKQGSILFYVFISREKSILGERETRSTRNIF